MNSLPVLATSLALVMISIGVHYELFRLLSAVVPRLAIAARLKVLVLDLHDPGLWRHRGDIVATGPLRLLAGIEGITGLVLIAWTASFAYVEMGHYWGNGEEEEEG